MQYWSKLYIYIYRLHLLALFSGDFVVILVKFQMNHKLHSYGLVRNHLVHSSGKISITDFYNNCEIRLKIVVFVNT